MKNIIVLVIFAVLGGVATYSIMGKHYTELECNGQMIAAGASSIVRDGSSYVIKYAYEDREFIFIQPQGSTCMVKFGL